MVGLRAELAVEGDQQPTRAAAIAGVAMKSTISRLDLTTHILMLQRSLECEVNRQLRAEVPHFACVRFGDTDDGANALTDATL